MKAFVLVLACAPLYACAAQRTLLITSEPLGAQVRMDDTVIGSTPLEWRFYDYGTHKLTLSKESFRSQTRVVPLSPPWYARFPMDVLTEVLFPVGWRDRHTQMLVLESGTDPLTRPGLRSVLERAHWLRGAGPSGPPSLPPARRADAPGANQDAPRDAPGGASQPAQGAAPVRDQEP